MRDIRSGPGIPDARLPPCSASRTGCCVWQRGCSRGRLCGSGVRTRQPSQAPRRSRPSWRRVCCFSLRGRGSRTRPSWPAESSTSTPPGTCRFRRGFHSGSRSGRSCVRSVSPTLCGRSRWRARCFRSSRFGPSWGCGRGLRGGRSPSRAPRSRRSSPESGFTPAARSPRPHRPRWPLSASRSGSAAAGMASCPVWWR